MRQSGTYFGGDLGEKKKKKKKAEKSNGSGTETYRKLAVSERVNG